MRYISNVRKMVFWKFSLACFFHWTLLFFANGIQGELYAPNDLKSGIDAPELHQSFNDEHRVKRLAIYDPKFHSLGGGGAPNDVLGEPILEDNIYFDNYDFQRNDEKEEVDWSRVKRDISSFLRNLFRG